MMPKKKKDKLQEELKTHIAAGGLITAAGIALRDPQLIAAGSVYAGSTAALYAAGSKKLRKVI